MDLGSFLADDSLGGSWADEEIDMSSIGVPVKSTGPSNNFMSARRTAESQSYRDEASEPRRDRQEYPIPDHPPFRARVGNLPWEANEESLVEFIESNLNSKQILSDVKLPVDANTGRLRGFGFVTFATKELLKKGLELSSSEFHGRRIYVDVAAPEKQDVFDMDWRAARSSGPSTGGRGGLPRGDRPPRREEADLDWSSARGSGILPPREPRGDRPPRKPEADLDWSSARGSGVLPPREPREPRGDRPPRKPEADLDWSSARGSGFLPPREPRGDRPPRKPEADLDWSSARGSGVLPPREPRTKSNTNISTEQPWKRGQTLEPRTNSHSQKKEEDKKDVKVQKSQFDVLRIDSDDDDEDEEELSKKTQNLSV